MKSKFSLHHIGIVVDNIENYLKNSFLSLHGNIVKDIYDKYQNARIVLISMESPVLIELIQPMNEKSFTYNFLKRNGNSLHHLCFKTDNIKEIDSLFEKKKIKRITPFVEAPIFNNKKVTFGYTRNKNIIEILIDSDV